MAVYVCLKISGDDGLFFAQSVRISRSNFVIDGGAVSVNGSSVEEAVGRVCEDLTRYLNDEQWIYKLSEEDADLNIATQYDILEYAARVAQEAYLLPVTAQDKFRQAIINALQETLQENSL